MSKKPTYQELENQIYGLQKQIEAYRSNHSIKEDGSEKIEQTELAFIGHSSLHASMIDNIGDVIAIVGADGLTKYQSKNVEKWFGWKPEEVSGNGWDKMHGEDVGRIQKEFNKIFTSTEPLTVEYRFRCKDGNYKWIQLTAVNRINDPIINGVLLNYHDITERKKAEEEIKTSEKQLKELNATKDKLFSIIAHDLRSPFNNIIGFSELLFENVNNIDSLESERYSEIINSTAKKTLILLDNLLNWAKSQTGELSYKPEKIILSEIILEIIGLKKSLAIAKNISFHYTPTNEIELCTDENILKTILRNLISNAVKFTNLGGHIKIFATTNQHQVEISISDNGVGIKDETIHKLFDLSTNVTSTGTANEKGSGLGLVLCKEFVEKLGGKIWVESEEGKGSDFKFTLPLNISK
mgnify:CR=1 FL=1